MASASTSSGTAEQPHQRVARGDAAGARAGVSLSARTVYLSRRYPGKTDARSLAAPYRAIAVPHPDGRADEGLAARHDRDSHQECSEHQRSTKAVTLVMRQERAVMYRAAPRSHRQEYHSSANALRGVAPIPPSHGDAHRRRRTGYCSLGPVRPLRATPRDGGPSYLHRLGAWQQNRTNKEQSSSFTCAPYSSDARCPSATRSKIAAGLAEPRLDQPGGHIIGQPPVWDWP